MPTYEYKREDGTTFEVWQGINDDPLEKCPETGQKVKRVISGGGGVVYKGDGFYITDYKKKESKGNNGRKAEESSSEKAESGSGSTSDKQANDS